MAFSHLIIRRGSARGDEILLAQRNIYLPPSDLYEFAALAHHGAQYVLPGGREQAGEQPMEAALRELCEDTGVELPILTARLHCVIGNRSFYEVRDPSGIDLGLINSALRDGMARSAKHNHFAWVPLDAAPGWLGVKTEYQYLPWVVEQVERAVRAGFAKEQIMRRLTESPIPFLEALDRLRR
jgi:ADP-ribose pyrophosphatase YjhB (NUDIX family)